MRRAVGTFCLLVFAVSLAAPGPARAQSREERDIRALLDHFFQFANSTDEKLVRQNLAEYSSSGGPFFPPFASSIDSLADLEAMVKQSQGQVISRRYEATSPISVHVDKNLGWAAYTWRAAFTFKDGDRKSTRLNSSHIQKSRMPSSA